ncbi:adenylate cyclase [Acrasis kona]|uniref:Adenylate cyclase n=1 Tax=Acrasis kona TaxID=1008807 RepID=A0AAW2ZPJ1_9EUKA
MNGKLALHVHAFKYKKDFKLFQTFTFNSFAQGSYYIKSSFANALCDVRNISNIKFVGYSTIQNSSNLMQIVNWPGISTRPNTVNSLIASNSTSLGVIQVSQDNLSPTLSSYDYRQLWGNVKTSDSSLVMINQERESIISMVVPLYNTSTESVDFVSYTEASLSTIESKLNEFGRMYDKCEISLIETQTRQVFASNTKQSTPTFTKHACGYELSIIGSQNNQSKFGLTNNGRDVCIYYYIYDDYGLSWVLVTSTPVSSTTGSTLFSISLLAGFSALSIVIVLVGLWIAVWFVIRPLYDFVKDLNEVERMRLQVADKYKSELSFFGEVRSIQYSFTSMVDKLKEYKTFLPDHIINRDFNQPDDDFDQPHSAHNKPDYDSEKYEMKRKSSLAPSYTLSSADRPVTSSKAFALGLEYKEFSVVVIEVTNIKEVLKNNSPLDFVNQHGRLLTEIIRSASKSKGDLCYFDQNKFVLSWNASGKIRNHAVEACNLAVQIKHGASSALGTPFKDIASFASPRPTTTISLNIGVATGYGYVGNIGNTNKRQFCIFGDVCNKAELVAKLSGEWDNAVMMNKATKNSIGSNFLWRPLDCVCYEQDDDREFVFELLEQKTKHCDDEWMYEMETKDQGKKYEQCIKAFEYAVTGNFTAAIENMELFLENNPGDVVAQRFLILCEELHDKRTKMKNVSSPMVFCKYKDQRWKRPF